MEEAGRFLLGREELEVSGDSLERQQQGVLTERTLDSGREVRLRERFGVSPQRERRIL